METLFPRLLGSSSKLQLNSTQNICHQQLCRVAFIFHVRSIFVDILQGISEDFHQFQLFFEELRAFYRRGLFSYKQHKQLKGLSFTVD